MSRDQRLAVGYDPYENDTGWFGSSFVKSVGKAAKGVAHGVSGAAKGVDKGISAVGSTFGKVPIVGGALKGLVTLTVAPYASALNVLSGERIDHAVVDNFKSSIAAAKDIAPYVQTVISFVPGIGTGISGAMSAALALAEGKPITEAMLAAAKGALPGGAVAAAAFDVASAAAQGKSISDVALAAVPLPAGQKEILRQSLIVAKDVASGKKVSKIVLDRANDSLKLLPKSVQTAAQVGIALGQGKNIQSAALKAAGQTMQNYIPAGKSLLGASKVGIQKAIGAAQAVRAGSPILKSALQAGVNQFASGSPEHLGFRTAVSVLSKTIGNKDALGAARRSLPTEGARRAFDSALGTVAHVVNKNPAALAKRAGSTFVPTMGKAKGVISTYQPNLQHAVNTLVKDPSLTMAHPIVLANKFGTSQQVVLQALKAVQSKRLLPWRSMSPRATAFIQKWSGSPLRFLSHNTGDTAGLDETGTKYIVIKGDSPFKIAQTLTGNGNRWTELKALNKDKKPDITKNVWVGEVLNLPPSWQKPTAAKAPSPGPAVSSQPIPQAPSGPVSTPAPAISVAPGIMQAKAILVAWGKTDGVNQAGVPDYGSTAADLSTDFGPRDKLQLMAFQNFSNKTGNAATLKVDGVLGPKSLAALQHWAETKAQATSPATPNVTTLPEILIQGSPPVQSPGLPQATPTVPTAQAPIPVASPSAPVTTVPSTPAQAVPAVAPASAPATPASVAATPASGGSKLGPALAGAAVGGTLFGLPGAIIGGIAGAAMS